MRNAILSLSAAALILAGCAGGGEPGEFGFNKSTMGTVLGGLGGAAGTGRSARARRPSCSAPSAAACWAR
jgi:hypothetical protein